MKGKKMLKQLTTWFKKLRKQNNNVRLYRSGWDSSQQEATPISNYIIATDPFGTSTSLTSGYSGMQATKSARPEDKREAKKPIDIYKEIFSEKPAMDLTDLDSKIKLVEKRVKVMKEVGGQLSDETEALSFLKARKKYTKFGKLFGWEIATFDAVKALCVKYKVAEVSFSSYSKTVPMEAIDEMEKFAEAYSKVSDLEPVYKLIIDDAPAPKETQSKERKKDPILLASSPFGKWWFVLGAWDKEVQIVDDLIYHGK